MPPKEPFAVGLVLAIGFGSFGYAAWAMTPSRFLKIAGVIVVAGLVTMYGLHVWPESVTASTEPSPAPTISVAFLSAPWFAYAATALVVAVLLLCLAVAFFVRIVPMGASVPNGTDPPSLPMPSPSQPMQAPVWGVATGETVAQLRDLYPDREFLSFDPVPLVYKAFQDYMPHQAQKITADYIGKWLACKFRLGVYEDRRPMEEQVRIMPKDLWPGGLHMQLFFYFEPQWEPRLSVLPKGAEVALMGYIDRLDASKVIFYKCELLS